MRPIRALLLLGFAFSALVTLAQTGTYSEGGYADKHSVAVGQTISFHIATSRTPFDVEIINRESPDVVIQKITGLVSQSRDCTGLWENGCGWPVTTVFTVPANYQPGYYVARFPTSVGSRHILFVVKPAVLGSYAPIAIIQPTNTDVAYNRFGGKSVYDTISDDGKRAHIVSFNRPYSSDTGLARFQIWEQKFVAWMKADGRKFEVITDDEMEAGVSLTGYKALVIVGHSEYWSLNARRHLEAFVRSGRHVAIFGANTMWWQVRVDLQSRKMTVYKDARLDPMTGVNDAVVTTNWYDWPVFHPENTILGASFLNAAYVNKLDSYERLPVEDRVPYTVRKADHWAFAGTGLTNGAEMGRSVGAIEVDGALFNTLPSGELVVEGSDGTPLSYEILATLPSSDGYATIGMYANPQGGAVFNGAARDWAYGLAGDAVIQQITRNVLDRLATGAPFPYQPRATPNRAEDMFNTPRAAPEYLPGWRSHRFGFELTPRCAREGPTGLELTGPRWTQVLRNVNAGPAGLTRAAANLWINADLLTSSPNYPTALVAFVYDKKTVQEHAAALEMMKRPDGFSLRVSSFDGDVQAASTAWVVLTPGWHSVQFSWESGGMLELNVSGKKVSAFNSRSGQKMTTIMLEFPGSVSTGSVCADHLQFRNAFAPPSAATSALTASPRTLVPDGTSKSTITLRLLDANGDPILNGGDSVTIATTHGSVSPVTDRGDGTYTATLTAATTNGTANISATVNGQSVSETTTVTMESPCTAPAITSQPRTQLVSSGSSATLTVSASGTSLSYQWYAGASGNTGGPIAGATGTSLTVTPASTTSYWVRVTGACGTADSAAATVTVPAPAPNPNHLRSRDDFNGDGLSDLLWRHGTLGSNYFYYMHGLDIVAKQKIVRVSDMNWRIAATADFNGDGYADILWRNASTGVNYIYLMRGSTRIAHGSVNRVTDPNWRIAGTGDFDGDGKWDILWRNTSTGVNVIYLMNGYTIRAWKGINQVSDTRWQIAATGDLDGDGKTDIVWRHAGTGENVVYFMDGFTIRATPSFTRVSDLNWRIAGTGDFNGDGRWDVFWRNAATGANMIYLMNGRTVEESAATPAMSLEWQLEGTGDYDGDARSDVVWRHSGTGENYIHFMNGTTRTSEGTVNVIPDMRWEIATSH